MAPRTSSPVTAMMRWLPARASTGSPHLSYAVAAVLLAVVFLFPIVISTRYILQLSISTLIWVGLAISWNSFSGFTRYFSLGSAGFFGVGAYTTMLAAEPLGLPLALMLSAMTAALVGLLVGASTLRLRGLYFTLVTIGLGEALRLLAFLWQPVTRGGTGLTLSTPAPLEVVYWVAASAVVVLLVLSVALRSARIGLRLIAIQDDEDSLAAAGVRVDRYKILGFAASVAPMGIFGGLYSLQVGFIDPQSVFVLPISLTVVIMVLLGGIGTIWGPVLGAVILGLTTEVLWARFPFFYELVLGVLLAVIVLFVPRGVVGSLRERLRGHERHLT